MKVLNRELSWLSFNERVLQEAIDASNPLVERLRFLGIYSNNRDEFFRVRVATVKRMTYLDKRSRTIIYENPKKLLKQIEQIVIEQEKKFNEVYQQIIKELEKKDVYMLNEKTILPEHQKFLDDYFNDILDPALVPLILDEKRKIPFLSEQSSYLALKIKLDNKKKETIYALVEIPTEILNRFVELPTVNRKRYFILLDDIIRLNIHKIFSIFKIASAEAYAIKITRDSELDFDEDFSEDFVEKLEESLKKRKKSEPVRFTFDKKMPSDLSLFLFQKLGLTETDNIIPGGRYHNFRDFIKFPRIERSLNYTPLKSIVITKENLGSSILKKIQKQDLLFYYPYHHFNNTIDILQEAAIDPMVQSIYINVYRLADSSRVANALMNAAKNGKKVTAVVELRARFDEINNIYWSDKLADAGVKVLHGSEIYKTHSKLVLIKLKGKGKKNMIAHVGTGNFHEGNAKVYTDISIWTADSKITKEVEKVFNHFEALSGKPDFKELLVSPFNTRDKILKLIQKEIAHAKKGKEAWIKIKLNNFTDEVLMTKLIEASSKGVKVKMIIRGICSLPLKKSDLNENFEVISVLGRFLEHSRFLIFANNGKPITYISSADWMIRNLDKRIEVSMPVFDEGCKTLINDVFETLWNNNKKARIIDANFNNRYKIYENAKLVDSQVELFKVLEKTN